MSKIQFQTTKNCSVFKLCVFRHKMLCHTTYNDLDCAMQFLRLITEQTQPGPASTIGRALTSESSNPRSIQLEARKNTHCWKRIFAPLAYWHKLCNSSSKSYATSFKNDLQNHLLDGTGFTLTCCVKGYVARSNWLYDALVLRGMGIQTHILY